MTRRQRSEQTLYLSGSILIQEALKPDVRINQIHGHWRGA